MTTIAWKDGTLAADSQSSSGDAICSLKEEKIFTPPDGEQWSANGEIVHAVGMCGDCGAEFELMDALRKGVNYSTQFQPNSDFTALAITAVGRCLIIYKKEGMERVSISLQLVPYAIGTGGMIARTAMHCGKDATQAVQIAIEMDLYSGGHISSFTTNAVVTHIKQD